MDAEALINWIDDDGKHRSILLEDLVDSGKIMHSPPAQACSFCFTSFIVMSRIKKDVLEEAQQTFRGRVVL